MIAGGYSNEFGGTSITSDFFPWVGKLKTTRSLATDPVLEWGGKLSSLANYQVVNIIFY